MMLGCESAAAARASLKKRSTYSRLRASSRGRIFSATGRSRLSWSARYTTAMAPVPTTRSTRKSPTTVPGLSWSIPWFSMVQTAPHDNR
ncbi:MAG: hypothetical protein BWZ02_01798 [Lentisphaerae bacterium ADurb.BinA184]|nr:MAG: hypothetical protein BWZ02_01798 [Lentisphaerae bacterium ADurb.BinA184]